MFELRTLGAVDLHGPDGRSVQSVVSQPKRMALLAYLALSPPGTFLQRDVLLAVFWPESDAERGRNALRQALHFLRRSLGADALVARGDGEVAVDADRIRCDAAEFERAFRQGRVEEAARLYGGEFLPGFHLADAAEFERWATRERQRLHELAARALLSLAEEREAAGDLPGAAEAWRRLAGHAPHDSAFVLRLMETLAAQERVPKALRYAESHRATLRDELGLEPDPRVEALAERLRGEFRERGVPADGDAGVPPPAEAEADPSPARTGRGRSGFRRFVLPVIAAAVGVLAVAWGASRIVDAGVFGPPDRAAPGRWVAVLPFTVRGDEELAYLGEGMVDLLSIKLDGAGEMRSVDPNLVLGAADDDGPRPIPLDRGRTLARQLGAGSFVLGSVLAVGERILLHASAYDALGRPLASTEAVAEGEEHLLEAVDRLAAGLLVEGRAGSDAEMERLAAITSSSLPAFKAYLRGNGAFRRQRFDAAVQAYREALAADSTFALAAYRLSVAADWAGDYATARSAIRQASRFGADLPETYRLLIRALLAFNNDAPGEAIRLYREVLQRQPGNVEAWYRLAETEYHYNPLLGFPPSDARPALERVVALDPGNRAARTHLALLAATRGDRRAFDAQVAELVVPGSADALVWAHLRAFAFGDSTARERLSAVRDTVQEGTLWELATDVFRYTRDLEAAARVARDLVAPHRSRDLRVAGHLLAAWIEMARGRPSAARAELARASALDPAAALGHRAAFATPHFIPVPDAELRAIRDSLEGWSEGAGNPYLSLYSRPDPTVRNYLLGILSARLGDAEDVERRVAALEPSPGDPPDRQRVLAQRRAALRARLAFETGDPRSALRHLERQYPVPGVKPELLAASIFERHLRPLLLSATGHEAEASGLYAAAPFSGNSFVEETLWDLVYVAPFQLRRARILDRSGDAAAAAEQYRRFIERWSDADPSLRPLVEEAERRLSALR